MKVTGSCPANLVKNELLCSYFLRILFGYSERLFQGALFSGCFGNVIVKAYFQFSRSGCVNRRLLMNLLFS